MARILHLAAVSAMLGLTAGLAYAQDTGKDWGTLNRKVVELFHAGQYDRAVVVAKEALGIAERGFGPDHPNVATSLSNPATLYRETKRPDEAEKLEARAKGIREIER